MRHINLIVDICLALSVLTGIVGMLFPQYTLYAWWRRRKLPHFKTAASLLEHLESVGPKFGEFVYDRERKDFHYAVYEGVELQYIQDFTTTAKLRDSIIQKLEANRKPWVTLSQFPSYQVEDLLPLARIDKLRALVA